MSAFSHQQLGSLLIESGKITETDLSRALQSQNGELLGRVLVNQNACSEDDLLDALSGQLGVTRIDLAGADVTPESITQITPKLAFHYQIIPLGEKDGVLLVAIADPQDIEKLDEIKLLVGKPVQPMLCAIDDIKIAIKKYYGLGAEMAEQIAQDSGNDLTFDIETETIEDIENLAGSSSVIKFVNNILFEGYKQRATDIHLEPSEDDFKIRFRVDGFLNAIKVPQTVRQFKDAIVSRIKVMADLDIAEKRSAQDGRIKVNVGEDELDLRVSVLPSIYGQTVNIRLLNSVVHFLDLGKLGFDDRDRSIVEKVITRPHGMVLLTGPTGSGKTTTLYGALKKIRSDEIKIITIEDPIEYRLEGITQMQVLPKVGLGFANGLRSMLRHDPDVMMVGEIRDGETAKIAVQASLTGHLVLSTLHTNDAASAITRLADMGIEPYLIASTVECLIAQRLVRTICPECKIDVTADLDRLREQIPMSVVLPGTVYEGRGCDACGHSGYRGRTGIFEVIRVDNELRELILSTTHSNRIKENARKKGMKTLLEDGLSKVAQGLTTITEIVRVTHEEEFED